MEEILFQLEIEFTSHDPATGLNLHEYFPMTDVVRKKYIHHLPLRHGG